MRHATRIITTSLFVCSIIFATRVTLLAQRQDRWESCAIAPWVDKSPWGTSGNSVLDTPCLSKVLKRDLPSHVLEDINQISNTPQKWGNITTDANLINIHMCSTKACDKNAINVFYDVNSDILQALMIKNSKAIWYAPGANPKPIRVTKGSVCENWKCWNNLFEKNKLGWYSHLFGPNDDPDSSYSQYIPVLDTKISSFPSQRNTSILVGNPAFQKLRKYIDDKSGRGYGNMLEDPFFAKSLDVLIGKERAFMISTLFVGPSSGNILDGDVIHYFSCRQHDCGGAFIIMYINLKENSLDICWAEDNSSMSGKPKNFWLSSGRSPKQIDVIKRSDEMLLYRQYHNK